MIIIWNVICDNNNVTIKGTTVWRIKPHKNVWSIVLFLYVPRKKYCPAQLFLMWFIIIHISLHSEVAVRICDMKDVLLHRKVLLIGIHNILMSIYFIPIYNF